ncbi:protein MULTIPOLAR SPINDLE 1 isoform X1 [Iris pallida]|uniref:Protein MULTIPOLAR SPINDLE 1 isoform X1 n=1 Tax=Iris pallida TaxID=29817 RepID=A0AAX6GZZ4_IRIPA|nr:protein MULTIPOLAR SPINDLE 1 isoform X1 [Iris pallida]
MAPSSSTTDPDSVKLALAISVALHRLRRTRRDPSPSSDPDDAQRWRRKAKERKREIVRLREEIKLLEDGTRTEDPAPIASCRCHFFDGSGDIGGSRAGRDDGGHWIDEVLRRRFLRLVRWKERRRRVEGSLQRRHLLDFYNGNEIEWLGTSIDFLVELTDTISGKGDTSIGTFSHLAVEFILASLKNLLLLQKDRELIEEIVNGLIMRLTRRMNGTPERNIVCGSDAEFHSQHLIRKLGCEPFVGQRIMLLTSQSISIASESILFMDPFDDAFPGTHGSMFMMIQLMEFLISDYMESWTSYEDFDRRLFEEWVRSILQARKGFELLECRNGLYMLYMERVVGELVKQVGPLARQGKLDSDILSDLLC